MFRSNLGAGGATVVEEYGDEQVYVAYLTGVDGLQGVVWHDDDLAATIVGPPGEAQDLYLSLLY